MMCQRIGRPPISIIGFGIRWVASPIRTPRPPQKITTFIDLSPGTIHRGAFIGKNRREVNYITATDSASPGVEPGSSSVAVGIGTASFAPQSAV